MSTVLSAKVVTTRKPHSCWGCGIKYPPGTKMNAVTSVDGEIATDYWCPTCVEYWDRYCDPDDVIGFGDLRMQDPEGWKAIRQELQQKEAQQ
jgi:hypothetical protein